jgi:hypothetical protein
MDRPPYGPDPTPCDFFLFRHLKQFVRDMRFSTEQELVNVAIDSLEAVSPEFWSGAFENRKGRLQTCGDAAGIYFEYGLTNGVFRFCSFLAGFPEFACHQNAL